MKFSIAEHEPRAKMQIQIIFFFKSIYVARPLKILIRNTIEMKLSAVSVAPRHHWLVWPFNNLDDELRFSFHLFFFSFYVHSCTIDSNEWDGLTFVVVDKCYTITGNKMEHFMTQWNGCCDYSCSMRRAVYRYIVYVTLARFTFVVILFFLACSEYKTAQ